MKYFSVVIAASLKFFAGPITGFAVGLSWYETALCSAAGMMLSVLIFTYLGKGLQTLMGRWRKGPSKRFSKSSRMAVRIWQKFGIIGIALLTPFLFTPIGGAILAVALRVPRQSIFLWMLISGLSSGFILSYLLYRMTFLQEWISK